MNILRTRQFIEKLRTPCSFILIDGQTELSSNWTLQLEYLIRVDFGEKENHDETKWFFIYNCGILKISFYVGVQRKWAFPLKLQHADSWEHDPWEHFYVHTTTITLITRSCGSKFKVPVSVRWCNLLQNCEHFEIYHHLHCQEIWKTKDSTSCLDREKIV